MREFCTLFDRTTCSRLSRCTARCAPCPVPADGFCFDDDASASSTRWRCRRLDGRRSTSSRPTTPSCCRPRPTARGRVLLDGYAGAAALRVRHAARALRGHLPRRRPAVLLRPRAAVRRDGRRVGADHAAPLLARVRASRGERHLQRPVPDLPPRRSRDGGAALVARPLHRVVLLPARGRQARRPEVPRRLARALRRHPRARSTRAAGLRRGTSPSTTSRERRTGRTSTTTRWSSSTTTASPGRGRRPLAAAGLPHLATNRELVYGPYLAALGRRSRGAAATLATRVASSPIPPKRERLQLFVNHLAAWFLWKTPWLMRYRHRRWRHAGEPSAETA